MGVDMLKNLQVGKEIISILRSLKYLFRSKHDVELRFWRSRYKIDKVQFENSRYRRLLLGMAGEENEEFLADKVVADFGCGPRGSLVWAKCALLRIGIDVLADRYFEEFTNCLRSQDMIYVKSTERVIPIPDSSIDVLYTLNAMDHVKNLEIMSSELLRILKPGGLFIGSFNLCGTVTKAEPQQLTEELLRKTILDKLEIESYRRTLLVEGSAMYEAFFTGNLEYKEGREGILWVRGIKK